MEWPVVALAATLLLAGCGGFAADERATVTPAPVPESAATVAPGLTAERIVSPAALAGAHEGALANVSYMLTLRWEVGSQEHETLLRVGRAGRFWYRSDRLGDGYSQQVFADGDAEYRREQQRLGVRYERDAPADDTGDFVHITGRLVETYLPAGPARITSRGNGTVVAVDRPPADTGGLENYTVRAVVTPAGLVRSFALAYRDETRDVSVRYRFRYTAVGETSVARPAWVDGQWGNASVATPTE